ncbi:polysaccharide lyase family 7 protein [Saccharothrix australiensis]|uniref:F5/8 type C domain-containing protein n=1 Tax=Saccharothrix australiensis TaxID=2072 RepID=A0A495W029_9PSEU|nr:polysaccharide lyase family 7 protein [Saccharothrix australiensis]RKT54819.1 F5/8 type C domain-containing protein [Saccharothrix australiensis]
MRKILALTAAFSLLATGSAAAALPVSEVTASDDDGNVAANVLDDDLGTRWSAEGDGAWIRFDLGAVRTVSALDIAWHKGDTRTSLFDVQTSDDGTAWRTSASGVTSRKTLRQERYDIPDASARYVRIVGHGNSSGNGWNSITEVDVQESGAPQPCGDTPAELLDLRNWKVTLPVDNPDKEGTQPLEITQPRLADYALDPWFVVDEKCEGVRFRAPVNGVTTPNSKNPRSELREMNGSSLASWSAKSGKHTMVIDQAITALPKQRPYVVAGQIHDSSDDVTVFRLEGEKLWLTKGDTTHHKLITDNYVLGTRFEAKFEVSGGEVRAFYNGRPVGAIDADFTGGYFKAGAYTQANCGNSTPCSSKNFGQVTVYGVTVTHS